VVNSPVGLSLDSQGYLYICERGENKIRRVKLWEALCPVELAALRLFGSLIPAGWARAVIRGSCIVRTSTKISSRPVLLLLLFILVVAGVLVGFGVPLVSSEGMIIRAHLVEGELPTGPEDATWAKV